ncbi:hypothetical protein ACZ90_06895 [Streptomyces albus subsp. albus]|nr:hypothetical protein ACZ90_06895 [Streptomyces albus subsp. albus]
MPGQPPDPVRSRALLVGIPEVLEGGFDRLDYVDANLEALRDALTRPPGGILAADRVTVLRSPSRAEWHHELRTAADQTEDLLLCYFVGHGYRHALTNVLHLMTRDADLDGDLNGTALAWAEVLARARKPTVRRALFLLDCCFSGMAAEEHGGGERGHYILASAGPTRTQPSTALPNGRSPFTDAIVTEMLRGGPAESGGLTMHTLFNRLHERMRDWPAPHVTDGWGPRNGSGGDGPDIILSRAVAPDPLEDGPGRRGAVPVDPAPPGGEASGPAPGAAGEAGRGLPRRPAPVRRVARAVRRWCGGHRRATAAIGTALAVLMGGTVYLLRDGGEARGGCPPPLQLRLLTSTENRAAVTRAVAAYTASEVNRRPLGPADDAPPGCRRTNITVYDAGAGDIVEAFGATGAWAGRPASSTADGCRPASGGGGEAGTGREANCRDPLQDIGPQPDILALGSSAELGRVQDRAARARGPAAIAPLGPGGYSPLVLAVPARLEDRLRAHGVRRTGSDWTELLDAVRAVGAEDGKRGGLPVLRPDPASSDIGLLHTVGLYEARDGVLVGGRPRDPRWAEHQVDRAHPAAPDAGTLLCQLAGGDSGLPPLGRAAVLVDEQTVADYNLGRLSACDLRKPVDSGERLLAYYPSGVPALDLPFAEVRWDGARDGRQRTAAIRQFHAWLTGAGRDSFLHGSVRGVTADRRPRPAAGAAWRDPADSGVLAEAEVVTARPDAATATRTAADYADTLAPGQVLFLVDTSGSMVTGGKQAMLDSALRHALNALGPQDGYGVWSYPKSASDPAAARTVVPLRTPGSDPGPARRWLDGLTPDGTRPGAAVYEVLQDAVRATRGVKHAVIVLITDGDDRPRGDPADDDYRRWERIKDRAGTPDVLVLSVRARGCAEVETQVFARAAEPSCFAGRPEDAARQLADRIGDYVQGGGAR